MGSLPPDTDNLLDTVPRIVIQSPGESDYAFIGKIALQHSSLEYLLETLIWHYMEDVDKGHIATARLGAIEKTEMLSTLIEWTEPDDGLFDAINWGIQCFHILRESRNAILHGFNFRADRKAGKLFIDRRTKSLVFDSFQLFEINRAILQQVTEDQRLLALYVFKIGEIIRRRSIGSIGPNALPADEPVRLPAKPSRPASLSPLPHETPKSTRRQRQELAEREAKQEKLDRKERQRQAARDAKKS